MKLYRGTAIPDILMTIAANPKKDVLTRALIMGMSAKYGLCGHHVH